MFCPKCGGKNDEDSGFCAQCGNAIPLKKTEQGNKTGKRGMLAYAIAASCLAVLVGVAIGAIYHSKNTAYEQKKSSSGGREVASNAVEGKVADVIIGAFGRGTIRVQSFNTGKVYTFATGVHTYYNIRGRYPYVGETVRVNYVNDRGVLKATYIGVG